MRCAEAANRQRGSVRDRIRMPPPGVRKYRESGSDSLRSATGAGSREWHGGEARAANFSHRIHRGSIGLGGECAGGEKVGESGKARYRNPCRRSPTSNFAGVRRVRGEGVGGKEVGSRERHGVEKRAAEASPRISREFVGVGGEGEGVGWCGIRAKGFVARFGENLCPSRPPTSEQRKPRRNKPDPV